MVLWIIQFVLNSWDIQEVIVVVLLFEFFFSILDEIGDRANFILWLKDFEDPVQNLPDCLRSSPPSSPLARSRCPGSIVSRSDTPCTNILYTLVNQYIVNEEKEKGVIQFFLNRPLTSTFSLLLLFSSSIDEISLFLPKSTFLFHRPTSL